MADVILIAGCLFQPLVFTRLAEFNLPKSWDMTLDRTLMDGTVARKITSEGEKVTAEKGFKFNKNTWTISITNFTADLIGSYTLQLKKDQKTVERTLEVVPKEPLVDKELEVKEFEEDGKKMMSCGTFEHFGDPKINIIWRANCRKINVEAYRYDEEKGLVIAEVPNLCVMGLEHFYDPVDMCKFYQCDSGGAIHRMTCALGTKWDQSKQDCVHLGPGEKCETTADTHGDGSKTKLKREANATITDDDESSDNKQNKTDETSASPVGSSSKPKTTTASAIGVGSSSKPKTTTASAIGVGLDIQGVEVTCHVDYSSVDCLYLYLWDGEPDKCSQYDQSNSNGQGSSSSPCKEGKFFAEDPKNKCNFYHCDESGNSWLKPCAPGTKWSQAANTCIHLTEGENCTDGIQEHENATKSALVVGHMSGASQVLPSFAMMIIFASGHLFLFATSHLLVPSRP